MKSVKISTGYDWPLIKQFPQKKAEWGGYKFVFDDEFTECDYWFVLYDINRPINAVCNRENIFFVCGEPEDIFVYRKRFIEQFGGLITTQDVEYNVAKKIRKTLLPWMVGAHFVDGKIKEEQDKDYDELVDGFGGVEKSKLISVITSDKEFTEGHKKRKRFVSYLKEEFKDDIDVYGRGIRDFEDKWDVIAPYKYHVSLENCSVRDYITEKLMDVYLAESYPIYYGCPNVEEYYPKESLTKIDIDNPQQAVDIIKKVINGGYYEKCHESILEGKKLALNKYNIFPMLCNIMDEMQGEDTKTLKKKITIYPNSACKFGWAVKKKLGLLP